MRMRKRAYACAPEQLGDVHDVPHGHPGQQRVYQAQVRAVVRRHRRRRVAVDVGGVPGVGRGADAAGRVNARERLDKGGGGEGDGGAVRRRAAGQARCAGGWRVRPGPRRRAQRQASSRVRGARASRSAPPPAVLT
jgi:hypothetical protein